MGALVAVLVIHLVLVAVGVVFCLATYIAGVDDRRAIERRERRERQEAEERLNQLADVLTTRELSASPLPDDLWIAFSEARATALSGDWSKANDQAVRVLATIRKEQEATK